MKNNVYLHCMPTVYSDGRKNVSHHFNYTFLRFCSNTKYVPWRSIGWETLSLSVLQHTLWKLSDFHFFFIYYRMVTVAWRCKAHRTVSLWWANSCQIHIEINFYFYFSRTITENCDNRISDEWRRPQPPHTFPHSHHHPHIGPSLAQQVERG